MNTLIIGAGGREHALAWKIAQSPQAERVFVAPGNGGTLVETGVENVDLDPTDAEALIDFARDQQIDLCLIGPEAPLVAGVSDALVAAGLRCCGPSQQAAQLEGSKDFAKAFMQRHGIPTAAYRTFEGREQALAYLDQVGAPVVVKADGLAAGKGVVVAETLAEARAAVEAMLGQGRFGEAGARVVIEDKLLGEEVSFIVLVSGEQVLPLATSQDHKARDEGDRGPNTGGMGAYSPAPIVTPALEQRIMREVIEPTVAGLRAEGLPYVGFLYAGLMIGADGAPRVLEYNCRLGDPETQPILMRLESDLLELCLAATGGRLPEVEARWRDQAALGVVMAAGGYPGDYAKGHPISGLDAARDCDSKAETSAANIGMSTGTDTGTGTRTDTGEQEAKVFHAGTKRDGEQTLTNGGRVLCVTALGADIGEAAANAYARAEQIQFADAFYRRDIGHRALKRGTSR
ncbi:phosphoribosylamine--glycine ligase [Halochromatium salexigens]|uniref:Phosphoribosylamine--glycine ligase n=1 Tax=Halochromatium salexigens TaxID=49447 RepID=A0AAJ0UF35_HALSE|nr:phosphoribosylamine--glycine ligase [Halochromatium salexigens]MBK5930288.1 phosphoribosylamine--glycine ligase [Halochromatium salexigens]